MPREATTPRPGGRSRLLGHARPLRDPVLAWTTPHPPVEPGAGVGREGGAPADFLKPKKAF